MNNTLIDRQLPRTPAVPPIAPPLPQFPKFVLVDSRRADKFFLKTDTYEIKNNMDPYTIAKYIKYRIKNNSIVSVTFELEARNASTPHLYGKRITVDQLMDLIKKLLTKDPNKRYGCLKVGTCDLNCCC